MLKLNDQLESYNSWLNSYYHDLLTRVATSLAYKPDITVNYADINAYKGAPGRRFRNVLQYKGISVGLRFNVAGSQIIAWLPNVAKYAYRNKIKDGVKYDAHDYYESHNWENDYTAPLQDWGHLQYIAKTRKDTDDLYEQIKIKHTKLIKDADKTRTMLIKVGLPVREEQIIIAV